jgi:hypothetical protein
MKFKVDDMVRYTEHGNMKCGCRRHLVGEIGVIVKITNGMPEDKVRQYVSVHFGCDNRLYAFLDYRAPDTNTCASIHRLEPNRNWVEV